MGQVIEQFKKIWTSLKTFWGRQTKKQKTRIIVVATVILAAIIGLVVWMNQPKYVILYSGLGADEQADVSKYLAESTSANYKVSGDTIYIEEADEAAIRMELSNQGHPYSTPNYDFYFKNVDTLTTSEERKLIEEYQLNQRLADVIKTIKGVQSATVTIAYPTTSNYVLSDENKGNITAGVTITLNSGVTLSQTQVTGIQTLVSTSVPGLDAANVSVINTATGEALASTSTSSGAAAVDTSTLKMDVENQYEADIQSKVLSVLQPIYGTDNVKVAVKCSIDINDSIKEMVTYTPSEDNKGVVDKEDSAYAYQTDGTAGSGTTGTDTNTKVTEDDSVTTYPGITIDDNTIYAQDEKSYDYLVSYVKEQVQKKAGEVANLTVSVILNKESISDSKRQELTSLIANSAAIENEKVVVYTDLFNTSEVSPNDGPANIIDQYMEQYPWLIYAALGAVALLLIIIILIVVIVKKKKKKGKKGKKKGKKAVEGEEEAPVNANAPLSLDADQLEQIQDIKAAKGMVMKQKIQEFSQQNPEIAAQLVKTWLRGEDK